MKSKSSTTLLQALGPLGDWLCAPSMYGSVKTEGCARRCWSWIWQSTGREPRASNGLYVREQLVPFRSSSLWASGVTTTSSKKFNLVCGSTEVFAHFWTIFKSQIVIHYLYAWIRTSSSFTHLTFLTVCDVYNTLMLDIPSSILACTGCVFLDLVHCHFRRTY